MDLTFFRVVAVKDKIHISKLTYTNIQITNLQLIN